MTELVSGRVTAGSELAFLLHCTSTPFGARHFCPSQQLEQFGIFLKILKKKKKVKFQEDAKSSRVDTVRPLLGQNKRYHYQL